MNYETDLSNYRAIQFIMFFFVICICRLFIDVSRNWKGCGMK
jgi:hypothetical protein